MSSINKDFVRHGFKSLLCHKTKAESMFVHEYSEMYFSVLECTKVRTRIGIVDSSQNTFYGKL